jgi:isocitrate dehydrogenase
MAQGFAGIPLPIQSHQGKLIVPPCPIIPFIEGDGSGPDIWRSAQRVLDSAVETAYQGKRCIQWKEVLAGEKAFNQTGNWLPEETLRTLKEYHVGIKGPLTTPIGEGMRSLNVALRKELDLFVCLRPVVYFKGVPSPMRQPEKINMVLFRENTEDLYAGIDYPYDSDKASGLRGWLKETQPDDYARLRFPETTAFGIKPVSKDGSIRLARAAFDYAIKNGRKSVTLVHKGNIMKYTEGAFARWAYELAETSYADTIYTQNQWRKTAKAAGNAAANQEKAAALAAGKIWLNELLTDAMFERAITHPADYDVLVTTNLNGDYLADALAALVGGIGIAPGGNINYASGDAIFEATHGTAPTLAGLDKANPSSLILSGEMMLRHLGWTEAADLLQQAVAAAILSKVVTFDFYEQMEGAILASTTEFANQIIHCMKG